MPGPSNKNRSRSKLLLGLLPQILLLSFLSFASTEDSEVKNSDGSIKKRCVYVDDGFELKDCGEAPTKSEFAEFLKKQAEDVARLAREFPCGYTYCPRFKRDLEFIYHSIEEHKNEDHLKNTSDDVGNGILNDQHISKEMLEETHLKTNDHHSEASDKSMKGVEKNDDIKPLESLLLLAGPETSQFPISTDSLISRARERFQKVISKFFKGNPKQRESKLSTYEEKDDMKEKSKTQGVDFLWRAEQVDQEMLKHLVTPDSYSLPPEVDQEMLKNLATADRYGLPSQVDQEMLEHLITDDSYSLPRSYNLPEPGLPKPYDRVPDDFQQIESTLIDDALQNLEPKFDQVSMVQFVKIKCVAEL
ncbi:hypothetical protein DFH28DRAFT_894001 [Melampsora americana]|nr:hypothetical protein DFH28DRAFT_894001 [Melampsora americana]